MRIFILITFCFNFAHPNWKAQIERIEDGHTEVEFTQKNDSRKMESKWYSEDEIVAAYAEIEGTDTDEVRAMRAFWRSRYGDDYKELRCQNTIARNWLNMKIQVQGLNNDIANLRTENTKKQATIDFQRKEIQELKTKAETANQFAHGMLEEAFKIRQEAEQLKGEAEAKMKEAEELMREALEKMAQTAETAMKRGQSIGAIVDELRENAKALFLKAKDGLRLKENMKQNALSLFSTMYDVMVERKTTAAPMSKEDFMCLMCYIFGYDQKHPLQALSSLRQRGGEMQIFQILTEAARRRSK